MLSDERIKELAGRHLDTKIVHHALSGFAGEPAVIGATDFARAIEREATAEATRIMREFVDANESKSLVRYVAAERAMLDYLERMK